MNPVETSPCWTHEVPDEAAVSSLAAIFAKLVKSPLVIFLEGDLGAGKTMFARAFIHALGYLGYVKSPTYGLLESYTVAGFSILHLDLYRIEDPEELDYLALRDLFNEQSILLVEWPEKGLGHLPQADMVMNFGESPDTRFISCRAHSSAGQVFSRSIELEL